jgi:hypothetical protein
MGNVLDLEALTCSHLRLHDALHRAIRLLAWTLLPGFTAAFAVMAWWGDAASTSWAPLMLLASLAVLGILASMAAAALGTAGIAARELSSFHDTVLQQHDDERDSDAKV